MEDQIKCPECGSTQIHAGKRGFKTGRAVAGVLVTGWIDVSAVIGATGMNKTVLTCLKCGKTFKPGSKKNENKSVGGIENKPLSFSLVLFVLCFVAGFLIPLCGGSWWFVLITPIIGIVSFFAIETHQTKSKKIQNQKSASKRKLEIDNEIKGYIKSGLYLPAIDYCRTVTGVSYEEAQNYVDLIASKLSHKDMNPNNHL